jgi:uncharacterized LabA/DUF88 family protein
MQVHCLADLFNLQLWPPGQDPTYADLRSGLEELVGATIAALGDARIFPGEVTFRLYGGWHGELPESGKHILALTSAVIRQFPRRVGVRVRMQIADSPIWNQSLKMIDSVRQVPLRPPGGKIINHPLCAKPADCTVHQLRSWWNGRCPEGTCAVRIGDLGFMYRQKMVDTLLTADAITLAREELSDALVIVSDDDDMLPAILAVSSLRFRTLLLRRRERRDTYYQSILDSSDVSIHIW